MTDYTPVCHIRRELTLLNALPPEKGMLKRFEGLGLKVIIRRSVATMTFDYQLSDIASGEVAECRELRTVEEMIAMLAEMELADQA